MKKICVITGTRAEYGLLKGLMDKINQSESCELQLIVSSMHLSPEFGNTYKTIEKDGFKISKKVEMLLSSDTETAVAKSMGLGTIEFTNALDDLRPDLVVILGDRFEILSACQASMVLKIPVAHIHGGELTEAAIDESIRHSVTKMSLYHFTSTEVYRKRVIQLGESPDRVFNTGAPGVDNIFQMELLSRDELSKSIDFDLSSPFFLVTYHPVTLERKDPLRGVENLLNSLLEFSDHKVIITMPNSDPHGRTIMKFIEDFTTKHTKHTKQMKTFTSLGQLRYLSALKESAAIIGNSSSGIIEAPALKTPTVNIGDRQGGRICDRSVICTSDDQADITSAIKKAISKDFENEIEASGNLYGNGNATEKIFDVICKLDLTTSLNKKFYDIEFDV